MTTERLVILDPTDEREPVRRELTRRPESITGTIALLDISKPRGDVFLNRVESLIHERLPGIETKRYMKPTVSRPAPESIRQAIREEADFVIEALAD
jgi:hypothetical protein